MAVEKHQITEESLKPEVEHEDKVVHEHQKLKSDLDELGLLQTAWRFRKAVSICFLLCVAAAADGYQINLNGNVIANEGYVRQLGSYNEKTGKYALPPNATALWGAMQSLGQLIGMIFLNPVSDRIGRKYTLYLLWVILAGSLILETLVKTWQEWAGAKLLAGIGVGCIQSTLPIYITEWSPVNIRGGMIVMYSVVNNIGGFLAPLILMCIKNSNPMEFRIPIYTQWAFLGIMFPIFLWLPETPSYFAAKDQDDKGIAVLRRVNGKVEGYNVEAEYAIIKAIILEERAFQQANNIGDDWRSVLKSYGECLTGVNLKRTIGSALPAIVQQLSGLAFLSIYASLFLQQSGFTNAFEVTSILFAVKIGAVIILALTTDRFGRRMIVLVCGAVSTLMVMLIGILGHVPHSGATNNVLIFAACMWSFFNVCLGALGWTFVGEVASQRLRARTAGISAAMGVVFGLTFNTSVPVMLLKNGANMGYDTAWIFFGGGLVSVIAAIFYLPETARRNPAELDEMYLKHVPAWKMKAFVTDVQREQAEARQ